MNKKENQLSKKSGCLFWVYLVINIASVLWILVGIISIKGTIELLSVLNDKQKIELKIFNIESYTTQGVSSKSKGGILHVFKGNIDGHDSILTTSITSNIDIDYLSIKKMINDEQLKIWFLKKAGKDFLFPQVIKPSKKSLIDYLWWSLLVSFFIPLSMLIRLVVLYKLGRFELLSSSENKQENENLK